MARIVFFTGMLVAVIGCVSMGKADRVYPTAHFKIHYTPLDDRNIKEIADSLEAGYPKITADLQPGNVPVVDVYFYENIAALTKVFPDFPEWAVGQAINASEIHMISPNDPRQDYHTMIRNTKHEFVHCVSLNINSTIGNNPRWLWEAVAIYEANFPWDPRMLPYLVDQAPPSLKELNEFSSPRIYEVGYFIAQFIAETHGTIALRSLIRNNGNLKDTLKLTDDEFTRQWFAFVKKKHGI
ncbi:hypothetical protein [Chitinophaga sp. YIM B06452]|uniref:hypothetical protein n=1 Tax=Chitinophaga sp. YIM B06452 TaxID=3082158 RepID=UPI0031FEA0F4